MKDFLTFFAQLDASCGFTQLLNKVLNWNLCPSVISECELRNHFSYDIN